MVAELVAILVSYRVIILLMPMIWCLLSPSAEGLNCLLGICESYAKKHDVVYNTTKSKVMLFPCKTPNVNPKLLMVLDQMEQIYEYV